MQREAILSNEELVLAALSTERGAQFRPVHVQKLFFLIDENLSGLLGRKFFNFQPYDYGPFDSDVYSTLETLSTKELVDIRLGNVRGGRLYVLTDAGYERGNEIQGKLLPSALEYISRASSFVRNLTFGQLVSAIYRAYPEMKVNSVFSG